MVKFFQDAGPGKPPAPAVEVPEGIRQIGDSIKAVMPMVEEITGLKRSDIFLQLMKTGLKGGNLETFINGFLGKPPAQEAKFTRYVKTLALWGPLALFLIGLALVSLYFFVKVLVHLMGSLPL